jgi:hypothetical protein
MTALRRLAVFVAAVVGEEYAGFAVLLKSFPTGSAYPAGIDEAADDGAFRRL